MLRSVPRKHGDFAAALELALDAMLERAGASALPLEVFRELALRGGPTPRSGPLVLDLLVPRSAGLLRFGLNVFQNPHDHAVARALEWSDVALGRASRDALAALLVDPPVGLAVCPGLYVSEAGLQLKLYFGSRSQAALPHMAERLAVRCVPGARGLAVDLRDACFSRARQYFAVDVHDPQLAGLSPWAARWCGLEHRGEGLGHAMLGALGEWPEPTAKRALVQTFTPDATLAQLERFESGLAFLPSELRVDLGWLQQLAGRIAALGFVLRPVAHELDLFPDGSLDTDLFVTLGEP
jgi:hypothetical protein